MCHRCLVPATVIATRINFLTWSKAYTNRTLNADRHTQFCSPTLWPDSHTTRRSFGNREVHRCTLFHPSLHCAGLSHTRATRAIRATHGIIAPGALLNKNAPRRWSTHYPRDEKSPPENRPFDGRRSPSCPSSNRRSAPAQGEHFLYRRASSNKHRLLEGRYSGWHSCHQLDNMRRTMSGN